MNPVAVHRVSFECVSRFSLIHREAGEGFSGRRVVNSRGRNRPIRRLHVVSAKLITSADSFEVGRLIGSYGFMNVTRYSHYTFVSSFYLELMCCFCFFVLKKLKFISNCVYMWKILGDKMFQLVIVCV